MIAPQNPGQQNMYNTFSAAASVAPIVLWSGHSQGCGNVYLSAKNTFLEFYTDEKKAIKRSAAARSWSWDSRVTGERSSGKSTYAPTTRSPSPSNRSVASSDGDALKSREISSSFNHYQHQETKYDTSYVNYHGSYGNSGGYHAGDAYPVPTQQMIPAGHDTMPCVDEHWASPYQTAPEFPEAPSPYQTAPEFPEAPSWTPRVDDSWMMQGGPSPTSAMSAPMLPQGPMMLQCQGQAQGFAPMQFPGSAPMVFQGQPQAPAPAAAPAPAPASCAHELSMMQAAPHVVKPRGKVEQPVAKKPISGQVIPDEPVDEITTLMIRGIPCSFSQDTLMKTIDKEEFKGKYDFFYLPRAGSNGTNLGYAFINFVDQVTAEKCMATFNGYPLDASRSTKICTISQADIQGLANLRKHFRKTAVSRGSRGPVFLKVFTEEESPQ